MLAWSIDVARRSGLFERVVVSTEDAEIAKVARRHGADVLLRPAELADDHSGTTEVIGHATRTMVGDGLPLAAVCCVYATAPFIEADDLSRGLAALDSGDWAFAVSATTYAAPIFRAFREHPEGGIEMFFPDHFPTRSQDLPRAMHDAAQFYWGRPAAWMEGRRLFDRHSIPVLIPRWRVQDIDEEDDWTRAELMFSQLKGRRAGGPAQ